MLNKYGNDNKGNKQEKKGKKDRRIGKKRTKRPSSRRNG